MKKTVIALLAFLLFLPIVKSVKAQVKVKVMPLGDSITYGYPYGGGYRIELEDKGLPIDFVGSEQNGPAELSDKDHEGWLGWEIDGIAGSVVDWLNTYQPEYVLLLIGTNDVNRSRDLANAPARLSSLIDIITNTLPNVRLLVGSIPPISDSGANARAVSYNNAIPGIVSQKQSQGKKVYFVDIYHALTVADLNDGVHPNLAGYGKMASAWYSVLGPLVNGNTPTSNPTISPIPTPTPSPTLTPITTPTSTPTVSPSPTQQSLPGDANNDNIVDGLDYVIWLGNYGANITGGPVVGDFNYDEYVDGLDYIIWLSNYS